MNLAVGGMVMCVYLCVEVNWNVQLAGGWEAVLRGTYCLKFKVEVKEGPKLDFTPGPKS